LNPGVKALREDQQEFAKEDSVFGEKTVEVASGSLRGVVCRDHSRKVRDQLLRRGKTRKKIVGARVSARH
jgi:hypothetical protein